MWVATVGYVRYVTVVKVSEVFRELRLWCLIDCACSMFIHVGVSDMVLTTLVIFFLILTQPVCRVFLDMRYKLSRPALVPTNLLFSG
jgi:hypothetical protein